MRSRRDEDALPCPGCWSGRVSSVRSRSGRGSINWRPSTKHFASTRRPITCFGTIGTRSLCLADILVLAQRTLRGAAQYLRTRARNLRAASVLRPVKELVRFRALLNGSVRHKGYEIGRFSSETHLMRHQDHRLTGLAEICDHIEHLSGHLRIKRGGRFIHQEELWIDRERSGDGDSLALTAAELRRFLAGVRIEAQALKNSIALVDGRPEIDEPFPSGSRIFSSAVRCGKRL